MKTTRIPSFRATVLITVLVVLAALRSAHATAPANAVPVIRIQGASLSMAIDILARQSQLNYILDPHLSDNSQSVSFMWTNITARDGLNRLLKEHGLELIENPATTVARIAPRNLHIKPVDAALVGRDDDAPAVPIISMMSAPLDQAIQMLADQAKLKIVLEEGTLSSQAGQPTPMVSFRWENLTARQALAALLDCYDLTLVESPDTAVIHIKSKAKN